MVAPLCMHAPMASTRLMQSTSTLGKKWSMSHYLSMMRGPLSRTRGMKRRLYQFRWWTMMAPLLQFHWRKMRLSRSRWQTTRSGEDEGDQAAWPWGSSDNDYDNEGPIRFPKVKCWFKCLICLRDWYEHKNSVLFHIHKFIKEEMGPPDVVEQYRQLSRLYMKYVFGLSVFLYVW
jgi:hypothetical protein